MERFSFIRATDPKWLTNTCTEALWQQSWLVGKLNNMLVVYGVCRCINLTCFMVCFNNLIIVHLILMEHEVSSMHWCYKCIFITILFFLDNGWKWFFKFIEVDLEFDQWCSVNGFVLKFAILSLTEESSEQEAMMFSWKGFHLISSTLPWWPQTFGWWGSIRPDCARETQKHTHSQVSVCSAFKSQFRST